MSKIDTIKSSLPHEVISKTQQQDIKGGAISTEDKRTKRTTTTTTTIRR